MPKKGHQTMSRSRAARSPSEAIFSDVARLLTGRDFDSLDDVNAFLQEQLEGGRLPSHPPTTAEEKAWALVDEALGAASRKRRVALAREALALSAGCVDAYLLLAEEASTPAEARAQLTEGVDAGARTLGADLETLAAEGAMWLAIETRPYMRARAALADVCWSMGDRQLAIAEMWELLRLNPGDNQGNRHVLLGWLLHAGSIEQIERLLSSYPDDGAAAWLYDRALHSFRVQGGSTEASRALRAALRANTHVPEFLLGGRSFPADLPAYVGWGDESEAVVYADDAFARWVETPSALAWLESKAGPKGRGKGKGRSGRT